MGSRAFRSFATFRSRTWRPQALKPLDFIDTARTLLDARANRPLQSDLRRAISSAYYGMFHCLAANCADLLIGGPAAQRSDRAWRQVYRAITHGDAKDACLRAGTRNFPAEIQNFARQFVTIQGHRHDADYAPDAFYYKSDVGILIDEAEAAIEDFNRASAKDRRAFAAWVLFKIRKA